MATKPVRADVSPSPLSLHLPLRGPVTGDPYTFLAREANAALSIAALFEGVDEDLLTNTIADVTLSPMFHLAKQSYRADLRNIQTGDPADAARREEFTLDVLLCRMYLAGAVQHLLPKAVR